MKVIELLNKIANGEEVPKKIQVYSDIFVFDNSNNVYEHEETKNNLLSIYNGNILNYEVRIIEEDKKIEHLLNGVDFENLKDNEKFDYLYEMETRIINYLEENK